MKLVHTIDELRAVSAAWRATGERIALVPTMGNLHLGHLNLVSLAADNAEHIIVSVFVNPTQFRPSEDYEAYPRTLDADAQQLARIGADILFAPSVEEMYPGGIGSTTQVRVPGLSEELCGASRPGHFDGVTSIVNRLINICQPSVAVFGQKDYQQFVILRRMVEDLHLPLQLIAGPIERDEHGLALSSRNRYLNQDQQLTAAVIYQSLRAVNTMLEEGNRDYAALENSAAEQITAAGLKPEYIAVREAGDLSVPDASSVHLVVLAAALLGDVRLIDNLLVELPA